MGAGPKYRCLTCNTVIQSLFRHDFRWCECPPESGTRVAIDGGDAYTRFVHGEAAKFEPCEVEASEDPQEHMKRRVD